MSSNARVVKFAEAIKRAYSKKVPEDVSDQIYFERWYPKFAKEEFDTAAAIIHGTKDLETLEALLNQYLLLFQAHAANRYVTHYSRSDQLFLDLFERCKKLSTRKKDLFGDWAALLDNPLESLTKLRFKELSPTYQTKIHALIPKQEAPPKRLLDYLREEFVKQHERSPKLAELYELDPTKDDRLAAAVTAHLDFVRSRFADAMQGNREIQRNLLHGALKAYRKFLEGFDKGRLLPLFQVIKTLQVRIRGTDGGVLHIEQALPPDRSFPTVEMYSMACMQLLRLAQGKLVIRANRDGFTSDEADYLLEPLKGKYNSYFSNIDDRFRRPMNSVEDKFALSTVFLDLMLITGNQLRRATLVNLATALELQRVWNGFNGYLEKIGRAKNPLEVVAICNDRLFIELAKEVGKRREIEVPIGGVGESVLRGHAFAHVGSSPGKHEVYGKITIIDIVPSKSPTFYVEFEHLRPHLFAVDLAYMTDKVQGSRIGDIAKSLQAASMVLGLVLQAAGYIMAVISGGFTGLVFEVVSSQVFGKIEEVAAEIDPIFGKIVGFGLQLVGTPNFARKVVDPNFSNVRLPPLTKATPHALRPDLEVPGLSRISNVERGLPAKAEGAAKVAERMGVKVEEPAVSAIARREQASPPVGQRIREPVPDSTMPLSPPPSGQRQIGMQQQMTKRSEPKERFVPPPREPKKLKPGTAEFEADKAARAASKAAEHAQRQARGTLVQALQRRGGTSHLHQRPIVTRSGRAQMHVIGDNAAYRESLRAGYQLYIYRNQRGQVIYAGVSGQSNRSKVLAPGTRERRFEHWRDRLDDEHTDTVWMQDAVTLEVYPLSRAQTILGEQVEIAANRGRGHNFNESDNLDAGEISLEGVVDEDILRNAERYVFDVVIVHN